MPKVSVIVPNYNHASYLSQRLESIFNQTYSDYEVIILDDKSTDNSLEIIRSYAKNPRVSQIIENNSNSGSTFIQIRKGLEIATGEYIWIAESDDWAETTFLEKTVARTESDISIIYTQSYITDHNSNRLYLNTKYTNYLDKEKWLKDFDENGIDAINKYFVYRNIIPNMSAVLMRREDLLNIDFPYSLKYLGDWFIYCQLLLSKNLSYISEPLNNYRQHSNTVRSKATANGLRIKEYFFLLKFLRSNRRIYRKGLNIQFLRNTKWWLKDILKIELSMNCKIAWNFIRFLI